MKIKSAKIKYSEEIVSKMKDKFGYSNDLEVPRVKKAVVNTGVGKFLKESDKIEDVINSFQIITGQRPIKTKAKKAVAGFKIRQGMDIGLKAVLRGQRMYDFIDRLVNSALPRTRDFQGISANSIDKRGNLNIGIKEHVIFPEISPEQVKNIFSLQVTIVTTTKNKKEGIELFKLLGFPINL